MIDWNEEMLGLLSILMFAGGLGLTILCLMDRVTPLQQKTHLYVVSALWFMASVVAAYGQWGWQVGVFVSGILMITGIMSIVRVHYMGPKATRLHYLPAFLFIGSAVCCFILSLGA